MGYNIVKMPPTTTKRAYVYEQIKRAIITGEIDSSTVLNESELSAKYGVGKTPTREALLVLTHENLLEAIPRVGYVITRLTVHDVLEAFSLRILLEVEATGLAAERIQDKDLEKLAKNNLEEQKAFERMSGTMLKEKAYNLNRDFHKIIATASGNQRLAKMIQNLINELERALSYDPHLADSSQHKKILVQLVQRNRNQAQEAMRVHLDETRIRILNLI